MKNVILLIVLFITSSLFAQDSSLNEVEFNAPKGELTFKHEIVDYGIIQQNSDGNRLFTFTNTGNAPIIITKVKASCGCTVATKPEKPIMPMETATIGVKYDTKRLGKFQKTITVTSNAKEPIKQIKIKGEIVK
jgi:hypothetical protein